MRLLLVTQDFPPLQGGIQTYMGVIAPLLAQKCDFFTVIAPSEPQSKEWDQKQSFPIYRVKVHSSFLVLGLYPKLNQVIREHQITHILYAQWFPALCTWGISSTLPKAVIAHGREYLNHPLGAFGLSWVHSALKKVMKIYPNSQRTAQLIPPNFKEKVQVINPGVDLNRYQCATQSQIDDFKKKLKLPADAIVVSTLTRLVERKGVDTLIQAFGLLSEKYPQLHVLIGGNGPDRSRLQGLKEHIIGQERIHFLGRIADEDCAAFYGSGIFCLLSREQEKDIEGFGLVLVEAQACGAAVICARSGGMSEAVSENTTALVVTPQDSQATAQAIERFILEPELRAEFSRKGPLFAQTLSWERCVEELYQSLRLLN